MIVVVVPPNFAHYISRLVNLQMFFFDYIWWIQSIERHGMFSLTAYFIVKDCVLNQNLYLLCCFVLVFTGGKKINAHKYHCYLLCVIRFRFFSNIFLDFSRGLNFADDNARVLSRWLNFANGKCCVILFGLYFMQKGSSIKYVHPKFCNLIHALPLSTVVYAFQK